MIHFDILSCAGLAFREVWQYRQILMRVALPVLLLKFILQYVLLTHYPEINLLQQNLVRIPDFFLEAWLYIGFVYVLAHGDTSFTKPFGPSQNKNEAKKKNLVLSGMLIYVLTQLVFNALAYFALLQIPAAQEGEKLSIPMDKAVFIFATFVAIVGLFRFLWLFVPVGVGVRLGEYLSKTAGFAFSARMFVLWLACVLPVSLLFFTLTGSIAQDYINDLPGAPAHIRVLVVAFESLYEVIVGLVEVAAMFFAIFFTDQAQKRLS